MYTIICVKNSKLRQLIECIVLHIDVDDAGRHSVYWSRVLREIYKRYYNLNVGIGSYGCFSVNAFPPGTIIGNYCSIASEVRYLNANHPLDQFTTHALLYNNDVYPGGGIALDRKCLKIRK